MIVVNDSSECEIDRLAHRLRQSHFRIPSHARTECQRKSTRLCRTQSADGTTTDLCWNSCCRGGGATSWIGASVPGYDRRRCLDWRKRQHYRPVYYRQWYVNSYPSSYTSPALFLLERPNERPEFCLVLMLTSIRLCVGTTIAAGAVVKGDWPANVVLGGVPCRILKQLAAPPALA